MTAPARATARTREDQGLAEALEDVVESAKEVAAQRAALVRLELGDAVARGVQAGALLFGLAIFAGFVAAALWLAGVAGAAWWVTQRWGLGWAIAGVVVVHAVAALVAWVVSRRRLAQELRP